MKTFFLIIIFVMSISCTTSPDNNHISNFRVESWRLTAGYAYVIDGNIQELKGFAVNDYDDPEELLWRIEITQKEFIEITDLLMPFAQGEQTQTIRAEGISGGRLTRLRITNRDNTQTIVSHYNHHDEQVQEILTRINQLIPNGSRLLEIIEDEKGSGGLCYDPLDVRR